MRSSLQCQCVAVATLNALMLVPSGREPVIGPNTKEGMMVTSSKPSDLLNSHPFFSAIVCKQIREQHQWAHVQYEHLGSQQRFENRQ